MPASVSQRDPHRRVQRTLVLALALLGAGLTGSGCGLFERGSSFSKQPKNLIPAMQPAPDVVRLDIVFVERPLGDALLGPELWKHVDELGAVGKETRDLLHRNGFRVGVVGAQPPIALQTLLGMRSDFVYEKRAEDAKQLVGHQVMIPSGGETVINTSPLFPECTVQVHQANETFTRLYTNPRCVFKVTTHREQDGWIRLDFVPEVQHGAELPRHKAGESDWQFSNSQKAETFFPHRFSVTLAVGEMALLTAAEDSADTLGRMFFVSRQEATGTQRLLVVRLSDMRNLDDPFAQRR